MFRKFCFISLNKVLFKKEVTEINDSVGGASQDATLDSLVLTEESIKGGEMVNKVKQM